MKAAIVALDEPLHLRPRVGELLGCGAQTFDAFFEQLERARQLELIALELVDDRLETVEAGLE
jgi:hypothetical protein